MWTEVEAETDRLFKSFTWKRQQWRAVHLTEDFGLELEDRWDPDALGGISQGEHQVLSLAFVAAMSHVTGEEAPLVIDAPFTKLASGPKLSVGSELPRTSKQIVLLVFDEELHSESLAALRPRIGREYRLDFDDAIGVTRVEQLA